MKFLLQINFNLSCFLYIISSVFIFPCLKELCSPVEFKYNLTGLPVLKVIPQKKKTNHIWKIADTLFEGDVRGNISIVNGAALIIHAWK